MPKSMAYRRKGRQLPLRLRPHGRGGPRPGAGRPKGDRVSHGQRVVLSGRHPVHVTLRMKGHVWNLRSRRCFRIVSRALGAGSDRFGFRLCHFSVQGNHLHLVAEANDARSLSRGIQGLSIRIAKGLNRQMGKKGRVFEDRYHARALRTPTEVKAALHYVLQNAEHHAGQRGERLVPATGWIDPCSSAAKSNDAPLCVVTPRTWLLREGWRRGREGSASAPTERV